MSKCKRYRIPKQATERGRKAIDFDPVYTENFFTCTTVNKEPCKFCYIVLHSLSARDCYFSIL